VKPYDVAVIGLGGIGSAALAHCAQRGVRAVGIERYERLHANGASSGESRIIRKAYFEDTRYVPLLERTYTLWHDLESETGRRLLDPVGILMVGRPDSPGIAGTLRTAALYDLPLERFDADQIEHHFPGTKPRPEEIGVMDHQAGIIYPEAALETLLDRAAWYGAEMRFRTAVTSWERSGPTHRLLLDDGSEPIVASRIIVAPGMWACTLLRDLHLPLRVQRNVQVWFEPWTAQFDRGVFPTYFVERPELPATLYGFPAFNGTLKAAFHAHGDTADPEHLDRRIRDDDVTAVRDALEEWMPGAGANYIRAKVCPYTLTPDGNFVIDRDVRDPTVAIACGFSGHGFKFCPVIGEILAGIVLDGGSAFDIDFLRIGRFSA
jgi:sarcosine oxidase